MNRKQRRQQQKEQRRVISGATVIGARSVLDRMNFHCPDCNSDVVPILDANGCGRVEVHHDDTCPTWQAMQ